MDQLDALVRDASHHNRLAGVTGVLLCDGNRFLQYLEGPEDGIEFVLTRVLSSRRHSEVIVLGRGESVVRRFPYWSMHWIPVEQHELRVAELADWTMAKAARSEEHMVVPGLEQIAILAAPHLEDDNIPR